MRKTETRGGRRNEAAKANGKAVGAPRKLPKGTRHTVTLDKDTLATLAAINSNLSLAIIEVTARQSHD